jgi:hyperosmotically inducible protein
MILTTTRKTIAAFATGLALLAVLPGCAVTRGQEKVGAYIDDTTITTSVKTKMLADKSVDGTSIRVETLNGEVMLSGFAKNLNEKQTAGEIARKTDGVKNVRNEIVVRG